MDLNEKSLNMIADQYRLMAYLFESYLNQNNHELFTFKIERQDMIDTFEEELEKISKSHMSTKSSFAF
jgi:hypothetical protein